MSVQIESKSLCHTVPRQTCVSSQKYSLHIQANLYNCIHILTNMYFYICINNNIGTTTNIVTHAYFLLNISWLFFISILIFLFIFNQNLQTRRKIYLNSLRKLEMFPCVEQKYFLPNNEMTAIKMLHFLDQRYSIKR